VCIGVLSANSHLDGFILCIMLQHLLQCLLLCAVFSAYSFHAQYTVPCTAVLRSLLKSEGPTLESWNFTLTERYNWCNFRQTKFKGLQGLFKDEVEIKKLKLSVHFFLHSVYQCFSYLFSYKIFGSSPINSPNHNQYHLSRKL